ncbi:MAG TPA: polysaccharide deacetylase family protein [Mobilitalea sp.]|nr:polysaccharide deacetylase family protein [Mobilitalea sp.]
MNNTATTEPKATAVPTITAPSAAPTVAVMPTITPVPATIAPTTAPITTSVNHEKSGTKLVALTFDDGPNLDITPLILDKLEEYDVAASFFLCGQNLSDATLPVVKRQLDLGCELNNHSWSHPDMSKMTPDEIIKQVQDTNDKIFEMVGVNPKFFRPPFIATSKTMYDNIELPFICGIGCNDWDATVTTQQRSDTILNTVKDGDIILLHDSSGNIQTVDALDTIISELQKQGYEFVTVSQLFEKKEIEPNVENMIWTNVN